MKNCPAPEWVRIAPKMVKRMMKVDVTCEGDAEDPLEGHVKRADKARDVVAPVCEEIEPNQFEVRSVVAVQQERGRRDRQDRTDGSARRLQHHQRRHRAQQQVDGRRCRRAVDELIEVDDRPGECDRVRSPPSTQSSAVTRARHRGCIGKTRKVRMRVIEQEADAVDLRLDDADHPVEGVERESRRKRGRRSSRLSPVSVRVGTSGSVSSNGASTGVIGWLSSV